MKWNEMGKIWNGIEQIDIYEMKSEMVSGKYGMEMHRYRMG